MAYTHSGTVKIGPQDETKPSSTSNIPGWNLFRSSATEKSSVSERKYDDFLKSAYKCLKMVTMLVVFLVTLSAAMVSKGATFFMVCFFLFLSLLSFR